MGSTELHVVFGAGQVCRQLVDRLLARGVRVRSVRRSREPNRYPEHETVQVDVQDLDAAIGAAQGASVVYDGLAPQASASRIS